MRKPRQKFVMNYSWLVEGTFYGCFFTSFLFMGLLLNSASIVWIPMILGAFILGLRTLKEIDEREFVEKGLKKRGRKNGRR